MEGLPKFVRDQMARTPAPSSHPDANALAAFTENTLTVKERQHVMEHLSRCADCREIVFLAQPEAASAATMPAPKSRRLTWVAWASVAAVVVVVGSAVLVLQEQVTKTQPATMATSTLPQTAEPKPAPPATTSIADKAVSDTRTRVQTPRREAELDVGKTGVSAERTQTTKDTSADEERQDLNAPPPIVRPPSAADQQVIGATTTRQQASTGPEQRNVAGQVQQSQGLSNTVNNVNIAAANQSLAKAESAPAANVAKKQRADAFHDLAAGYAAAPATAPVPSVRAHWQISPTGMLERSYTADNWTPVLAESGVKFRIVSVIGNTVWAGGEHGALYVSRDGGATWNPIAIDTTATITSIHFSDDLRGKLETGDGQTWETSDGGKSWQKQ